MSVDATAAARAAASWLAGRHVAVASDWVDACVAWILEESQGMRLTQDQINAAVYNQWLVADLHEIRSSCLPSDILSKACITLNGCYSVQIDCLRDISQPCYAQLTKITGTENENMSVTAFDKSANRKWDPKPTRLLLLSLTDGSIDDLQAFEYSPIPSLSSDLPAGTKALIKGPVTCRSGVLLLTSANITVLGGEVEALKARNCQQAVLRRALGELDDDAGKHKPARGSCDVQDSAANAAGNKGRLAAAGASAAAATAAGSGTVERRVGQQAASSLRLSTSCSTSSAAASHRSPAGLPAAIVTAAAGPPSAKAKSEPRQLEFDIADFDDDDDFDDCLGAGGSGRSAALQPIQPVPVKKSPDTMHSAKIFAQDARAVCGGARLRQNIASSHSPAAPASCGVLSKTRNTDPNSLLSQTSAGEQRSASHPLAVGLGASVAQKRLASAVCTTDFLNDEDELFDDPDFEQNFQDVDGFNGHSSTFNDHKPAMDRDGGSIVSKPPTAAATAALVRHASCGEKKDAQLLTAFPLDDHFGGCDDVIGKQPCDEMGDDDDCVIVAAQISSSSRRRGPMRVISSSSSDDDMTGGPHNDDGAASFSQPVTAAAAASASTAGAAAPTVTVASDSTVAAAAADGSKSQATPMDLAELVQDNDGNDIVDRPPFTYLRIINDLIPTLTERRTFVVKAYVRTLTGNLKLNKHRGWSLTAYINDGSAGMEVVFSDEVLQSLIGHSAPDFARLKKTWKDGGSEALGRCQRQLANLSCLMEIDVSPHDRCSQAESVSSSGSRVPSVAKLREVTAKDVQLLRERLARRHQH